MSPAPSRELLALQGALAGRYSIEREIGRGGMGRVYLARDVALDRPVAMKVLPPEQAGDPGLRERFLREARTAARLNHPNIVPIFSVEEIGEFVFFVMSYVAGETLRRRVATKGPLPAGLGSRILRDITWGITYAHSQGVVHRDIKPENILIETGSDRALVTDFGIAKVRSGAAPADDGEVLGTPEFMSPEQASGAEVDQRSDLYSLGVVAFFMFAGRVPFTGRTAPAILAQHIGKPAPRLASAAPGVPARIAGLVDQCLAKRPEARLASGDELLNVLAATLEQRREIPPPVRIFIGERKAAEAASQVLFALTPWLLMLVGSLLFSGRPGLALIGAAIVLALIGVPFIQVVLGIQRLLKAGHRQDDLVQGLEQEVEQRREELIHLFGKDYREQARRLRHTALAWLVAAVAMIAGLFVQTGGHGALIAGAVASAFMGLVAWHRENKRTDRKGMRRLRLWRGALGRALFAFAGAQREDRSSAPALTNRPTEVAVGIVVQGLFEALPKPLRSGLLDLPQVVRSLEADARRMRANIKELDTLLVDAPLPRPGARPDDAERVAELLRSTREQAAERLAQTVAAMEKLRIDLLRLRNGSVTIAGVTQNLGDAKELSLQVRRLLAGMEEVQRTLGAR